MNTHAGMCNFPGYVRKPRHIQELQRVETATSLLAWEGDWTGCSVPNVPLLLPFKSDG